MKSLYEISETPEIDGICYIDMDGKFVVPTFLCNRWQEIKLDLYVQKLMTYDCTTVKILNNWLESLFPERPDYVLLDIKSKNISCYDLPDEFNKIQLLRKGMPYGVLPSLTEVHLSIDSFKPGLYHDFSNAQWRYWMEYMVTARTAADTFAWYKQKFNKN